MAERVRGGVEQTELGVHDAQVVIEQVPFPIPRQRLKEMLTHLEQLQLVVPRGAQAIPVGGETLEQRMDRAPAAGAWLCQVGKHANGEQRDERFWPGFGEPGRLRRVIGVHAPSPQLPAAAAESGREG
jgi:hypothetical protein